jgi:hypothetical protein
LETSCTPPSPDGFFPCDKKMKNRYIPYIADEGGKRLLVGNRLQIKGMRIYCPLSLWWSLLLFQYYQKPYSRTRDSDLHNTCSHVISLSLSPSLFTFKGWFCSLRPTFFFFFCGTGVWTQDFELAKQALCHLSHTFSPFYSGYFRDGGLVNYLPGLKLRSSSTSASQIARITGVRHQGPIFQVSVLDTEEQSPVVLPFCVSIFSKTTVR